MYGAWSRNKLACLFSKGIWGCLEWNNPSPPLSGKPMLCQEFFNSLSESFRLHTYCLFALLWSTKHKPCLHYLQLPNPSVVHSPTASSNSLSQSSLLSWLSPHCGIPPTRVSLCPRWPLLFKHVQAAVTDPGSDVTQFSIVLNTIRFHASGFMSVSSSSTGWTGCCDHWDCGIDSHSALLPVMYTNILEVSRSFFFTDVL